MGIWFVINTPAKHRNPMINIDWEIQWYNYLTGIVQNKNAGH
jgi:hypothetical protein